MKNITFVTSNPNKAREVAMIVEGANISSQALELDEIQSFCLREIVEHKALQAFSLLKKPVLVEDVAFDLEALKGFPGPFIKFWEKEVGHDAAVEMIEKIGNNRASVRCGAGYADGDRFVYSEGRVDGAFVSKRGGDGWGFDFYFVPDGQTQTYAEMGCENKLKISHRKKAWEMMRAELCALGIIGE